MKKKVLILCLIVSLALPLAAVDGDQVMYVGGTAATIKAGEIGRLDLTSADGLIFEHAGNKLTIPYAELESFQYTTPVTHHLGVLPAIAVRLVRARRHRHMFRFVYRSPGGAAQTVILEVPKSMSETLNSLLETRIPRNREAPVRHLSASPVKLSAGKVCAGGKCPEVH